MTTLISADNHIALFALLCAICAIVIYLEQNYKWAAKITGCIMVLLITLVLSNLRVTPESAPAYDFVGNYLVPMALPLLLFKADIKSIVKDSGRLIVLFFIGAVGTCVGSAVAFLITSGHINEAPKFIAMITGSYIGGGVNFVAMADNYGASGTTVATANVADALTMMFFFFALMVIPSINFFKKHWLHPYEDKIAKQTEAENGQAATSAGAYWGKREISLFDLALEIGLSLVIVAVSTPISEFFSTVIPTSNFVFNFFNALLGSKYLIITVISVIIATIFSDKLAKVGGAQELGTYFIYLFFATMSAPVSIRLLVGDAPWFFVACMIIVVINILFVLLGSKLLHFGIEEAMICSNANIGGGSTAMALAIAKNWTELIIPGLLVGTLGNVIGNFFGILMGTLFGA